MEAEETLQKLIGDHAVKKKDVEELVKRVDKCQEELNQLNRTLKQVEEQNAQMKSEIDRQQSQDAPPYTYRAEEAVVKLENRERQKGTGQIGRLHVSMNEQVN